MLRGPLNERFFRSFSKTEGCWLWTKSTNKYGYGIISDSGKGIRAHRLSWVLHNGPIPEGLFVLHHCDVRLCVRPDHLFLGTHQDNRADCVGKGRQARGECQHSAKLTEGDVVLIRTYIKIGLTLSSIADRFGVTKEAIYCIKHKKTWKHVRGVAA